MRVFVEGVDPSTVHDPSLMMNAALMSKVEVWAVFWVRRVRRERRERRERRGLFVDAKVELYP